ncbi:hypothetical protein Tco_1426137 [Tanacetum coccineum]
MVPTKKVDKTPYELWYGKFPNLSYLKVWGCEALVKRDMPDKLEQRFVEAHFARVATDQPVAYLPIKWDRKGGLISKGLKSLADFEGALRCDQSDIYNKVITVVPGLFNGRGIHG